MKARVLRLTRRRLQRWVHVKNDGTGGDIAIVKVSMNPFDEMPGSGQPDAGNRRFESRSIDKGPEAAIFILTDHGLETDMSVAVPEPMKTFQENSMPNSVPTPVSETKIIMSDPTALGVFGLSMVTFVAASQKMGWTSGSVYVIPWALFLGSIAQIWASSIDFKKNNYFGAIVLGAYGLFWIAVAMHWAIGLGWLGPVGDKADPRQLGVACIGYFIFSLFIMVAALEANKVFAAILLMINVLLPSLALSIFGINAPFFSVLAAYSELAVSLLGFYCAGAVFLNSYFGRTLLPLGKTLRLHPQGAAVAPGQGPACDRAGCRCSEEPETCRSETCIWRNAVLPRMPCVRCATATSSSCPPVWASRRHCSTRYRSSAAISTT